MCGIVGVVAKSPVNQILYDSLTVLQHRGQDAAGICTAEGHTFHMHKGKGLTRDVFRTRDMRTLKGHIGIGHCRYPTAGNADSAAESQPFYVNSPFGIVLAHNGNLTNAAALHAELFEEDKRHVNTNSDSEVLLNVLAHELSDAAANSLRLTPDMIFRAVAGVHRRCEGAYSIVALISGYGLVAFRDPFGIRPLIIGRQDSELGVEFMIASESVALESNGFQVMRDVEPGEVILVDYSGNFMSRNCAENTSLNPCMFEYVYLARPDSVIDGISVYEARSRMGRSLAEQIAAAGVSDIDVVIPIPDSSRPSAVEVSQRLNVPYREGFVKNRYIGRTFIMPGQEMRKKSVRQKLNPIGMEFAGKVVLLVDDSIVRGTTSKEIVQMARDCGARKVYFASAAPPVRFPNVYGIDMPNRNELIATNRTADQIAEAIGADAIFYQDLNTLISDLKKLNPAIKRFDCSCFDGEYITGRVSQEYLDNIENARGTAKKIEVSNDDQEDSSNQLDFGFSTSS